MGWPAVAFVSGLYSAEDLAHVPGGDWLVASGMAGPHTQGHLYAIDTVNKSASEIWPEGGRIAPDETRFDVLEPPDPSDFSAVGVGLRAGACGVNTLYVVNHGSRAAIEVFDILAGPDEPTATWVGAIPLAEGMWGNAVAPLADGGLLASNYMSSDDPRALDRVKAGEVTGNVKEWHRERGWEDVPNSECCSANGVDVTPDGRWLFVNAWATCEVIRVARAAPFERRALVVPMMPDNVKLSPRGRVLVTGQTSDARTVFDGVRAAATYDVGLQVIAIDPDTLATETLLEFSQPGGFGTAATALEVGDTIWISSARGDRVAYFKPDDR